MRALFNASMRAHVYMFPLLVLALFLTSELLSQPLAVFISQTWVLLASAALALAWLFQRAVYKYVGNDPTRQMAVAMAYCRSRTPHPADLPVWNGGVIPPHISTYDEHANTYLSHLHIAPFLPQITRTQFDDNPLRFSWLRARKNSISLEILEPLDQILYHNNRSTLGMLVRFFTRSYWEHIAIYIGNGEVLDVAPGGVKRVPLQDWIEDINVELAVIRYKITDNSTGLSAVLKTEGHGYNYVGVAGELWRILAGSYNPFGLNIVRLILFLGLSVSVLYTASTFQISGRAQIALNSFMVAFLTQATWHPLAYTNNFLSYFQIFESSKDAQP